MTTMRSPLGRARGLGSAKAGVHHFWVQRVTAVALAPLSLWFVFSLAQLPSMGYAAVHHWVSSPSVAVALVLFVTALAWHSLLGVQVIIEDYVGHEGAKIGLLLLSKFIHAAAAATAVFAVLLIALRG